MTNSITPRQNLPTRRDVMAGGAGLAISLGSGISQSATTDDLHTHVAEKARQISGGQGTLKILMPNGCGANVDPVIEKFQDLTGITVRTQEVAVDEINAQLTLDGLGSTADYDLALPATFGIPDLAAGGIIVPLTDYAKRHEPTGFRNDVLYSIGDSFDDEIYGFQADGDTYVMFYHKDWMEDANEQARYADNFGTPLRVPETWEELDQQMAFFHRPEENRFGGALFRTPGYLAWEWWVRFHAKGVWPMSPDLEPQIASEQGVSALEDMIRATESLYPQARSAGLFENWAHYGAGNTFCNIGWGGSQKFLNGPESKMRGRMLYGLTPSGRFGNDVARMPYFNWGWNYVVTSASGQPELAYLFALFASTPTISTMSVREQQGYFDPFRPEHYDDLTIQETYTQEFLSVHRESLEASIPDLYLAQQGEYFRILSEWLDAAVNGQLSPEEALARASTQWNVLNLRVGREAQGARWQELREKYPKGARKVLRDLS